MPKAKPKKASPKKRAKRSKPKIIRFQAEAFGIDKPGEVRRRHEAQEELDNPGMISIEQKKLVIDNLLSKFLGGVSCEELIELGEHVLRWAAEIAAVHEPEVPDHDIVTGKIFFGTDPVRRILMELQAFCARQGETVSEDDCIDYWIARMRGEAIDRLAPAN